MPLPPVCSPATGRFQQNSSGRVAAVEPASPVGAPHGPAGPATVKFPAPEKTRDDINDGVCG
jgi:hypothetical protein